MLTMFQIRLQLLDSLKFNTNTILSYLMLLVFVACGKNDDETIPQNLAPKDFEAEAVAANVGLEITVTWSAAIDPEEDIVVYDVTINDEIVSENQSVRTYSFNADTFNEMVSGKIVAKDTEGNTTESAFSITSSSMVHIPDANFEQALIDEGVDKDNTVNAQFNYKDAAEVSILNIFNKNISDLTGISVFTNLKRLNAHSNQLTIIDISKNPNLTHVGLSGNQLSEIDVTHNTALTELSLSNNKIKMLDVSENKMLTGLFVAKNQLEALNIEGNTVLETLDCKENQIIELDIDSNTQLKSLNCRDNQIVSLKVDNNAALTTISADDNELVELELTENKELVQLFLNNNKIGKLDLSNNPQLQLFSASSNKLMLLNVKNGNNTSIASFFVTNNPDLAKLCVDNVPMSFTAIGLPSECEVTTICE